MHIQLLTAATAGNSVPSGVDAGFPLKNVEGGHSYTILVKSTAGSDAMTVTLKIWGYSKVAEAWLPLGISATPASKGLLNGDAAIAEGPTADSITHSEVIGNMDGFDRVYLEVVSIGGTATAVSAWLVGG